MPGPCNAAVAAVLPRLAAVADRRDRHAAAARNSCRRGQVRAWRNHRASRPRHAVLHAVARSRPRRRRRACWCTPFSPMCSPACRWSSARAAIENALISSAARSQTTAEISMKNIALADEHRRLSTSTRCAAQFPILARMVRGRPLAYLDNGASAQRPNAVIEAVDDYERRHHANIHRGVHTLEPGGDGTVRECARDRLVAVRQRALAARNHLRARHHRGHQSRGAELCAARC